MNEQEEAIVRRAFDRAIAIARRSVKDPDDRLAAFFGAMCSLAGCPEVTLDVLKNESSAKESPNG